MTIYAVKASVEFVVEAKDEMDAWQQADNQLARENRFWTILDVTKDALSN